MEVKVQKGKLESKTENLARCLHCYLAKQVVPTARGYIFENKLAGNRCMRTKMANL